MSRKISFALAVCMLSLAACSLRKAPTGHDYYAQGQLNFSNGEYHAAIENYQRLIDYFPFSPYAEDAELKIGLAYYAMGEYAEAVATLDDFQRMHPTDKRLGLVNYYMAMSYFDQIGREDQDQSKTEAALERFETIEQRFPEGAFAELARERASICREMLARHELIVGNFYFKRANFRAAESRMAELMQKYPNTPVAPDALYELALALEKEGKKYSAAQAFAALVKHFPNTEYANRARQELARLKQPIDTEEDPLELVLAESGYPPNAVDHQDHVIVRQKGEEPSAAELASSDAGYGPDGLPILDRPSTPLADGATAHPAGPATLRTVRLSAADPPLSVILDLTGPVKFEQHLTNGRGYSTAIIVMKNVKPDGALDHHLVFDRSIFRDCNISSNSQGTTVTLNTVPVTNFAVVPLDHPARLLVTFTPQAQAMDSSTSGM